MSTFPLTLIRLEEAIASSRSLDQPQPLAGLGAVSVGQQAGTRFLIRAPPWRISPKHSLKLTTKLEVTWSFS